MEMCLAVCLRSSGFFRKDSLMDVSLVEKTTHVSSFVL